MKRSAWPILALCILLTSCSSGYAKFYRSNPYATRELIQSRREAPAPGTPLLEHSGLPLREMVAAYQEQGFEPIGDSSFNGASQDSDSGAMAQAKKVGADLVVIVNPQYTGTRSSIVPIVTPHTTTSYTSGTATAYGSGAPVTAYGSATTTTYGTNTTYVPMSTDRYDFAAVYFVKLKTHFGVRVRELTDDQRRELQTNRGVEVASVMRNSPAFNADVLPGDILLSIANQQFSDATSFGEVVEQHAGQASKVRIYRAGNVIEKMIVFK